MISFYFLSIILQDCFLNEIGEMNVCEFGAVCECVSLVLCDRIRVFDPFLVFGK